MMVVTTIIIGSLLILFLIIWFTNVTILIDYSHQKDDDHFKIQLRAWKFIRYNIEIPVVKVDKDEPRIHYEKKNKDGNHETGDITPHEIDERISDFNELMHHVFGLYILVRKFLKTVKIKQLEWNSIVGVKDAALTGVLTGIVWSIKGGIVGVLSHYMKLMAQPQISVHPSFRIPISQTKIKCMFKIRIGNAILAGLKILKFWRNGKASFKTKPLSIMTKDGNHSV
jgi:hypothetical protein